MLMEIQTFALKKVHFNVSAKMAGILSQPQRVYDCGVYIGDSLDIPL